MKKAILILCAFVVTLFAGVSAAGRDPQTPPRPPRLNRRNIAAMRARAIMQATAMHAAATQLSPISDRASAENDSDEEVLEVAPTPQMPPTRKRGRSAAAIRELRFEIEQCVACKVHCLHDIAGYNHGVCHPICFYCLRKAVLDDGVSVDGSELLYCCPACSPEAGAAKEARLHIRYALAARDFEVIGRYFITRYGSVAAGMHNDLIYNKQPLQYAVELNDIEMITWCLAHGANPHVPDHRGIYPVENAVTHLIASGATDSRALQLLLQNRGWGDLDAVRDAQVARLTTFFGPYRAAYRDLAERCFGIPENAQLPGKK